MNQRISASFRLNYRIAPSWGWDEFLRVKPMKWVTARSSRTWNACEEMRLSFGTYHDGIDYVLVARRF